MVDFIDMYKAENRKILFKQMREAMSDDRAKHNVLPPSKIGLIQITRERVRPQVNIETSETCPSCKGTGKVAATVILTDEIEIRLKQMLEQNKGRPITLMVHPYVEAYLKGMV